MVNAYELSKYVERIFDRYNAIRADFLSEYDAQSDSFIDRPLFPGGFVDDWTLSRLSIHLGMDKQEILNMDELAARRYAEKYPFFGLYNEFLRRWAFSSGFKGEAPTPEEQLLLAIFGEKSGITVEPRYNYSNVKSRLVRKLKEIDAVVPGTYHKNAKIENLHIETEIFFSFPRCPEMIRSFNTMVQRLKELFFKAVNSDLCEEEIHEMNFLASWFHAGDRVMPNTLITYENVCRYREAYKEETYKDFFSYVKIRRFSYSGALFPTKDFIPWRCKEFFDDIDAAQQFCNAFPGENIKAAMREFMMKIMNFYCWFNWSDAAHIEFSPEEESEMRYICDDDYLPVEERAKRPTELYVEKTAKETSDWTEYIDVIKKAISPEKKGGLKPVFFESSADDILNVRRTIRRVWCRN
jgi:hypothetical protein